MTYLIILNVFGFTLDVIGKIIVAYTALAVHHRFRHEHKVDTAVFRAMKKENYYAILGIVLIILGYILQIPHKLVI